MKSIVTVRSKRMNKLTLSFIPIFLTLLFGIVESSKSSKWSGVGHEQHHLRSTSIFEILGASETEKYSNGTVSNATISNANVNYSCSTPGLKVEECNYRGTCTTAGYCICDDGYTTYPENSSTGCNYKQKSRVVAFLLSFFLGAESGAGEWYLGNTGLAVGQLLLLWGGLLLSCCCTIGFTLDGGDKRGLNSCFTFFLTIGVIVWWFYDWISIVNGDIKDSNGVDTYNNF